jgi:hypothetical protein
MLQAIIGGFSYQIRGYLSYPAGIQIKGNRFRSAWTPQRYRVAIRGLRGKFGEGSRESDPLV